MVWRTPLGDIRPDDDSKAFFAAAAAGRYLIKRCCRCATALEPALIVCRACGSSETEWSASQGIGTLISYTRMHRAYDPHFSSLVPYFVGVVQLAEGPLAVGRIQADRSVTGFRLGSDFRVIFEPLGDIHVPVFLSVDGE